MKISYFIPILLLVFCSCKKNLDKSITDEKKPTKEKQDNPDFKTIIDAWDEKYADYVSESTVNGITTVTARFDFTPMGAYGFPYHYGITFSFNSSGSGSIASHSLTQDPPTMYWGYGCANCGPVTNKSMYTDYNISRTVSVVGGPPVLYTFEVTCTTQYYTPGVVYAWIHYKRLTPP